MKTNTPYCYLYKNKPKPGDLYVSTVFELPAGYELDSVSSKVIGNTTTVTFKIGGSDTALAGIRKPADVEIDWNGEERWVEVIVDTGTVKHKTFTNSQKAD